MRTTINMQKRKFLLLLACCTTLSAQEIRSPKEGATLYQYGSYLVIFKGFPRKQKKVDIELYKGDAPIAVLKRSATRYQAYRWSVDSGIAPGDGYRIKITGHGDTPLSCMSGTFTIVKPDMKVVKPSAGSKWTMNDSLSGWIEWKMPVKLPPPFRVELLKGDAVYLVLDAKHSWNSMSVKLKQDAKIKSGEDYRIRVTLCADTTIAALSDPFSIVRLKYAFPELDSIPLVWMPKEDAPLGLHGGRNKPLFRSALVVAPFNDRRKDPSRIGVNIEEANQRPVTAREPVTDWCREQFITELHRRNLINVVHEGETVFNPASGATSGDLPVPLSAENTITLHTDLIEFFVLESSTYKARVAIDFSLVDETGNTLWQGAKVGSSDNWGKSYSAVNYYESLTTAFTEVLELLFTDPKVERVLGVQ